MRPSGRFICSRTVAPNTVVMKSMNFCAPATMRYGVMAWSPPGMGFAAMPISFPVAGVRACAPITFAPTTVPRRSAGDISSG